MIRLLYQYGMALAVCVTGWPVFGAALRLSPATTRIETKTIRVPVLLGALENDNVAALQFDVSFDASALRYASIETGDAAEAGEKSAHANVIRPGQLRVIVAGLNQNTLPEGTVAWIVLNREVAPRKLLDLHLSNAVLSDPFGTAVEVQLNPDTLSIDTDSSLVLASRRGNSDPGQRGMEMLSRYRALLFAAVVVGLGILLTRRKPRKGRVR